MEAQQGRRAARGKARNLILPGSEPVPLRDERDHGPLWERLGSLDRAVARLEGKMSVVLVLTCGTFLAIVGLLLTRAF